MFGRIRPPLRLYLHAADGIQVVVAVEYPGEGIHDELGDVVDVRIWFWLRLRPCPTTQRMQNANQAYWPRIAALTPADSRTCCLYAASLRPPQVCTPGR